MNKRGAAVSTLNPLCEPLEARVLLSVSPQVIGYLPDYEFSHFSSINLNALTQINYFSIVAGSNGSLPSTSEDGASLSQLATVVTAAHAAGVLVSITIDPSTPFLTIAESSTATSNFVSNIIAFCSTYHLDGVDLDYEPANDSLTQAQMNTWGSFLATLHAATSAHGLILSEAVQVSPPYIIPTAYLSDIDRYLVMDYDLDYNSSAPYSASLTYLQGWATYGVPKADLYMGIPFYGRSGTSWSNSTTETYQQIVNAYEAANDGALPPPGDDTLTIDGTTWGFNGVTTVQNKTQYVLQNGYGGVMIWELGQDYYTTTGGYAAPSLLPAIEGVIGAAWETWTGAVSDSWSNAANWNFGQVPGSSTNVVINGGNPTISSPFSVASLVLNGGILTLAPVDGVFTTSALTVSAGATLDMGNNTLYIDYGTNPDPISSIISVITSGYNDGSWTGTGIMSTTAQSNSLSYGLGYADSVDPGNPANLATTQIKIMYTLLGDANLDGDVNGADFTILAAHFNQGDCVWDEGDFNYDGDVNGADFTLLSNNFNQSVAAAPMSSADDTESTNLAPQTTSDDSDSLVAQDQIASPSASVHHHHESSGR
jgi:hypothetical protein